ncbi:hypothetical protein Sgou_14320 [Streptomyces gougerotii]|uniref:Secreted protein n=2 Tax=Streptomyces diastaticus group TaxID=2849069 RepID=A0ABQ1D2H6_9ACTN|nr:hypothetical protein Sdia_52280 [Streptomyces diastaticus subsp. diastaticus]GFH76762.1 hypothetical protein Sgou_14320 [Streptomyces gougerotii]GGU03131.1 hypothetical protein GCM10015534_00970 [Streptomyces diastaticus subsp. diastaticus]
MPAASAATAAAATATVRRGIRMTSLICESPPPVDAAGPPIADPAVSARQRVGPTPPGQRAKKGENGANTS